jgi:pyruvate/2-oxoglutarate dehydrogenase complex dihydrolipoamide dehydrogenase (E3) component
VLEPDYLVLATGSSYPFPAKTEEPDIASARSRFRAFGVRAHSEYLDGGSLDDRRDERGYVRVDQHLRVVGETRVFALGDGVADAVTIAELKGRHMGTDHRAALFDAAPEIAA